MRGGRDELLVLGIPVDGIDRFGNTPLDEAKREGHAAVVELLERAAERNRD